MPIIYFSTQLVNQLPWGRKCIYITSDILMHILLTKWLYVILFNVI